MSLFEQLKGYFKGDSSYNLSYPPPGTAKFAVTVFISLILLYIAVYLLLPDKFKKDKLISSFKGKFIINIFLIFLFFFTMEALITLYIPCHTAYLRSPKVKIVPWLLWMYAPGAEYLEHGAPVKINSQGLREREIPLKKAPGEYRVINIGDSNTWGKSLPVEETFSRKLEILLQKRFPKRKITVINGGMQGCTVMQGFYLLREIGLKYEPDLVIINRLHNISVLMDAGYMFGFEDYRDYLRKRQEFCSIPLLQKLQGKLLKSNLYLLLRSEYLRFVFLPSKVQRLETIPALKKYAECLSVARADFTQQFVTLCKNKGLSALFVNYNGDFVREIGTSKIYFVNLPIDSLKTPKYTLAWDSGHFNALGHTIIAKWLFREIIALKLIQ
jgi:lysophospholipase L1-like esterase